MREFGFDGPHEAILAAPGIYQNAALIASPAAPSLSQDNFAVIALAEERFFARIIRFS